MNWLDKVKKNILPISQEKQNVKVALDEWEYHGVFYDLEEPVEICELCDHQGIRYQFEILNVFNGNTLLIGSECILKFKIKVLDEYGKLLDHAEAKRKVNRDKNKLIATAKKRSVINAMLLIVSMDDKFNINNFIKYYEDRGAFTPKQLSTIFWRLKEYKINFNKSYFKITIKRKKEKEQLLNMKDWQLADIWPCLTNSQKNIIKNHKNKLNY